MKNNIVKHISLLMLLLCTTFVWAQQDYYWVGGSGSFNDVGHWSLTSGGNTYVNAAPSENSNLIFDENSGFTAGDNTVTLYSTGTANNITFNGTTVPVNFEQDGYGKTLNIHGSTVWQTGMPTIKITNIYYKNTGSPKTITSNGVTTGNRYVYFEETSQIDLLDDFKSDHTVNQLVGTLNTNNHGFEVGRTYNVSSTTTAQANFGSSIVVGGSISVGNNATLNINSASVTLSRFTASSNAQANINASQFFMSGQFSTSSPDVVFDAGTSHIHFVSGTGISAHGGQTYYDVSFEDETTSQLYSGSAISHNGSVTFRNVVVAGNVQIQGDNTYENLTLAGNKDYLFQGGKTQTITNSLTAVTPVCGGWSTIKSTSAGSPAVFSASAATTVSWQGAIMTDVHATGGANFEAVNSIDQGNNTGWIFPPYAGKDLFWVGDGNDGLWNNADNWSLTSGGTGGACVPGPQDDVFFDANSSYTGSPNGNTVKIENNAYCHDITFNGSPVAPIFTDDSNQDFLNIYGSSEWQIGMTVKFNNIIYHDTGEPKTIKSNGVITGSGSIHNSINWNESTQIALLDDFKAGGSITQSVGTFNTNNHKFEGRGYSVSSSTSAVANLGESIVDFSNGTLSFANNTTLNVDSQSVTAGGFRASINAEINLNTSQFFMSGSFRTNSPNVTLNAGTSHIHFVYGFGIEAYAGQTYYDVSFEDESTSLTGQGSAINNHSGNVNFHNVVVAGNAKIEGDNTYENLTLAGNKDFLFQNGKTQTITSSLTAVTPVCGGWSTIKSTSSGSPAIISAAAGVTVNWQGTIMTDIHANGGATFEALNSIDQGNNTGWTFPPYTGIDLYWVGDGNDGQWNNADNWSLTSGGAGGACVPGPKDNVFFDANSSYTGSNNNNTVQIENNAYCNDITFNGSPVAPSFIKNTSQDILNIYGSSEWQTGMTIDINYIFYHDSATPKTITSNGVAVGTSSTETFFDETTSIDIVDDYKTNGGVRQSAGVVNSNNHKFEAGSPYDGYVISSTTSATLNLGTSIVDIKRVLSVGKNATINVDSDNVNLVSFEARNNAEVNLNTSEIFMQQEFNTQSQDVVLDAGTSHIHFVENGYGLEPYEGQTYYDVSFERVSTGESTTLIGRNYNATSPVNFNDVTIAGSGRIYGDNTFASIQLSAGKIYSFEQNKLQDIVSLLIYSTPCDYPVIKSMSAGTHAQFKVTGGDPNYNFVRVKDIDASQGNTLYFDAQSIDEGNNLNIDFVPYDVDDFPGFEGQDFSCYLIDNSDEQTYTVFANGFYANPNSIFTWYVYNESSEVWEEFTNPAEDILDIRPEHFGPGTYKLVLDYNGDDTCKAEDTIVVKPDRDALRIEVDNPYLVCDTSTKTLAEVSINGQDIKFYETANLITPLPLTHTVNDGDIYYVTQTIDGCESTGVTVEIKIESCLKPVISNPMLPTKAKND